MSGLLKNLTIALFIALCLAPASTFAQDDQASLLLDLKKARAAYEIARQKLENDRKQGDGAAVLYHRGEGGQVPDPQG